MEKADLKKRRERLGINAVLFEAKLLNFKHCFE